MAADPAILVLTAENGFSLSTSVLKGGLQVEKAAHFDETVIMNRSSPVLTYNSSSAITINFILQLVATDSANFSAQEVNELVKGLMSLTFPVSPGVNPPPVCTITYGSGLFLRTFKCLCTSVGSHMGDENLYTSSGDPMTAEVALSFIGIELFAQSDKDFGDNSIRQYKNLAL